MIAILLKKAYREAVRLCTFWLPRERQIAIERRIRGQEEYKKLRQADLVIVSFGKSGRTWLRVMMSRFYQLRYGLKERHLIGFDNLHRMNPAIPRIHFTHDNYIKDYTGNADSKKDFYDRKVVLMVRDPRDVAVSQYHQWKFRMRPSKKDLNDYPNHDADISLHDFVSHPSGITKVIDFMNLWAKERPNLSDLLIVRYEDLRRDTAHELDRVLRFAGSEPTPAELEESVAFAAIDRMRDMETRKVFWLSGSRLVAKDKSNPNSFKVRRAKVGGYRDDFEPEQLRAMDDQVDRELASGFGYRSDEADSYQRDKTAASA
ncbi:sulfotransferase domain-containing protein [Marinivivus vitaminiproducens]|uniref:sulfotransferase domain-containing protein n=1 Tax=Marinivivus vitaminiproducens TaxID=3035935 RepID=UPI0027A8640F|nr:sulfotransferase domain-containing protein [Geminicoccaceae bacterium SCSIO 64248]